MTRPISIGYKCKCMAREVECGVRGRMIGETIKTYIEWPIRIAISLDHSKRAPKCRELITEYVALPFDANEDESPPPRNLLQ